LRQGRKLAASRNPDRQHKRSRKEARKEWRDEMRVVPDAAEKAV